MSDVLDMASATTELHLQAAIQQARTIKRTLPFTGLCHNCEEGIVSPKLFCDKDCSDDYHKRLKRS